jgi:hypothetical protein
MHRMHNFPLLHALTTQHMVKMTRVRIGEGKTPHFSHAKIDYSAEKLRNFPCRCKNVLECKYHTEKSPLTDGLRANACFCVHCGVSGAEPKTNNPSTEPSTVFLQLIKGFVWRRAPRCRCMCHRINFPQLRRGREREGKRTAQREANPLIKPDPGVARGA